MAYGVEVVAPTDIQILTLRVSQTEHLTNDQRLIDNKLHGVARPRARPDQDMPEVDNVPLQQESQAQKFSYGRLYTKVIFLYLLMFYIFFYVFVIYLKSWCVSLFKL